MNRTFEKGHLSQAEALRLALREANPARRQAAINAVVRSGSRLLVNPQAGLGIKGPSGMAELPADTSAQTAVELLELGLRHLLQDVPLQSLNNHPDAIRGAETLAQFCSAARSVLAVPGPDGLFRLNSQRRGDRIGVLVNRPVPTGWGAPIRFDARRRLGNYGATEVTWRELQRGNIPEPQQIAPGPVPMSTGRDIASLVELDPPITIPEYVSRQLLAANAPRSTRCPARPNEMGFVSYAGPAHIQCAIGAAAWPAAQMGWRVKWVDHRRQRPEEMWPRAVAGELHPDFLRLGQWIVDRVGRFLPMPYAAGCPLHSDNPSGHALFAGVGFTLLKAWFSDGPVPALNIASNLHAELDLMAWHQSDGRSWARIHSIHSIREGLLLGQRYAIEWLNREARESPEVLGPVSFMGFNGVTVNLRGS